MSAVLALLGGILLVLLAAVWKVLAPVLTREVETWLPHATDALLERSLERLTPGERERYEAEWRGDRAEYADRPLSAFVWALTEVWWSSRALARAAQPQAEVVQRGTPRPGMGWQMARIVVPLISGVRRVRTKQVVLHWLETGIDAVLVLGMMLGTAVLWSPLVAAMLR